MNACPTHKRGSWYFSKCRTTPSKLCRLEVGVPDWMSLAAALFAQLGFEFPQRWTRCWTSRWNYTPVVFGTQSADVSVGHSERRRSSPTARESGGGRAADSNGETCSTKGFLFAMGRILQFKPITFRFKVGQKNFLW